MKKLLMANLMKLKTIKKVNNFSIKPNFFKLFLDIFIKEEFFYGRLNLFFLELSIIIKKTLFN
jgi:hypothetical protein